MSDPSTIAGLYSWHKADAITGVANGGAVASWPDSGGGGFTLTNGSTGTQPTLTLSSLIGSKPALAIYQGSSSGYLGNTSAVGSQATQTLSVAFRPTALTSNAFVAGTTGGGLSIYLTTSGKIQLTKSGNAVIGVSATALTVNANYVVTVDFTNSGAFNIYINGTKDTNSGTTTQSLSSSSPAYAIGASNNAAGEPFRGFLAEVVHYTAILGSGSRSQLHSYFQDNYGITMSDYVSGSVPAAVSGLTATPTTGQVALAWTAPTGSPTSYKVLRRGALLGTVTTTAFTETGLPGGVQYDYTVIATNANGNSDPAAVSATTPASLKAGAPKVIWDTDMSADIDDLGSVALLHALADLGECDIIGMGVSSTNGGAALALNAVNTYYGRPNIPIGVRSDVTSGGGYPAQLASEFPHAITSISAFPNAVTLYRQLLASVPSASVVFITVGFLNNLSGLLSSPADGTSSLTGSQLIAQKIKLWSCMGGVWPSGSEYNFKSSGDGGAGAFNLVNNWPSAVQYAGYEVGGPVYTGGRFEAETPVGNIARRGYQIFNGGVANVALSSSDQIGTLLGIRPTGLFGAVTNGSGTATSDGTNAWVSSPDPSGALEQSYVLELQRAVTQNSIDALQMAPAAAQPPLAPAQPSNLIVATSGANMVLTWTRNSYSETGFIVERRDSGIWGQVASLAAGVTTWTDTNPGSQINRAYRVSATNTKGSSLPTLTTYYASWTQTNLSTPANVPFYTFFHPDMLRYAPSAAEDHVAVLNDFTSGSSVTIDVDVVTRGDPGSVCVYFLLQDLSNWYRVRVTNSATVIEQSVSGTVTQVGSSGAGIPIQKPQHWTVAATPSGITFTAPSLTLASPTAPTFTSGKTGVGGLARGPVWSNYAVTGSAAPASTSGNASPGGGALALVGSAPPVSAGVTATIGAASLTIAGSTPQISAGLSVSLGAAALIVAGLAPTASAGAVLPPMPASLALAGYSPGASGSTSAAASPGAGSLAIVGYAPGVSAGSSVTVPAGALSLSGLAPSVSAGASAQPGTGAVIITGYTPSAGGSSSASVTPGVGVLTLTGCAPTPGSGATLLPASAVLSLSGLSPGVSTGASASPATAAMVITGYAPSAGGSSAATSMPGVGTLTLTGYPPVPRAGATLLPAPAVLSLSGIPPSVSAGAVATPGPAAMVITGYAPSAGPLIPASASPGTGSLIVAGFAPSVSAGAVATPAPSLMRFIGYAPSLNASSTVPDVGSIIAGRIIKGAAGSRSPINKLSPIFLGDTDGFLFDFSTWFPSGITPSSVLVRSSPPGFTIGDTLISRSKVALYITAPAAAPGLFNLLCTASDGTALHLTLEQEILVIS